MIRDFTYIDDIVSGIKGAILNPSKANEGNIISKGATGLVNFIIS